MATTMPQWNRTNFRPRRTTLSSNGCLILCWIASFLATSPGDLSAQGVCDRTPQVQDKLVEVTGVSDCAEVTTEHLASIMDLSLSEANISQLQSHDFDSLTNLKWLSLEDNQLSTLPQGVFNGLSNLAYLGLRTNKLRTLPPGVFSDLDSLEHLDLGSNIFRTLPEGIFDDVLDTLRSISTGPSLNAHLAFASIKQNSHQGETVRVRATLSQALPVAARIPYTVSGTATPGDYSNLTPDPDTGILFRAGETSKEITFTVSKSESALGKTVALTLAEESQIKLRRSDGAGEDAPYLDLRNGVFLGYYHGYHNHIPHTVTIVDLNICRRTPKVRDKLVEVIGVSDCAQVTPEHLARVNRLDLSGMRIRELKVGDFSGLDSLGVLWLHNNALIHGGLRKGIFDDVLDTLEDLRLDARQRPTFSFWSRQQVTSAGHTVRVRVFLKSGNLPVEARMPYSVGGTLTTDNIVGLPLPSERVLAFPAVEWIQEIEFIVPEDGNSLGKTLELRLGDVSLISLRRSDGVGPDAPHLKAEALMNVRNDKAVHTITVVKPVTAEVCSRTPQVRDAIIAEVRRGTMYEIADCADVTTAHLNHVTDLGLFDADLTSLQEIDFRGLSSMRRLWLVNSPLNELPPGVFSGLSNLEALTLDGISLNALPQGVFRGMNDLESLSMQENSLTVLPHGIFQGLHNLRRLDLSGNSLGVLSADAFQGLNKLETLDLWGNSISTLPEGVFRGLHNVERMYLNRNQLQELPDRIFSDLNSLKILWLTSNNLSRLHPGSFRGLSSIEGLYLSKNALTELPADLFHGLDTLKSLTLYRNDLRSLPQGIFSGLNSLHWLTLHNNSIDGLPMGIFDDLLDTLGDEYVLDGTSPQTGRLTVPGHLQARLAFASPGQQAAEGLTVRVPVTLSREVPVRVIVPYTLGFGGLLGGVQGFSPPPDSGLLFPAGETRREIVFTLPREDGIQGPRSVVLTLGKSSEIVLRRSDGRGPDAPHLKSESLVSRSGERTFHTVTVSDVDPDERKPFCLSLWGGTPCSTAATLPHAMVGTLGEGIARTELALTHRDTRSVACDVAVLFHRGTSAAGAVSFNGHIPDDNLLRTTVPRGGAKILTLAAPEASETGAIHVLTRSPCTADSLHVEGRTLLESPGSGEIEELVSVPTQTPQDWLADGDCRVLTGVFGNGRDVVLALVTAHPNLVAPPGTRLEMRSFDLNGNFIGKLPSVEVSGVQGVLSAGEFHLSTMIEACLNVPGTGNAFHLAVTAIGSKTAGGEVQYGTERLAGGSGQ